MDDDWLALLRAQYGVVTQAQAEAHGISPACLEGRVLRGIYQRLGVRTVATFAHPPSLVAREVAACLANPCAYLSHASAGRQWNLKQPPDERVHIVVPARGKSSRGSRPRSTRQLRVHRSRHLPASDVTQRSDLPVTSLERTIVDLHQVIHRPDDRRALVAEAFRQRVTTKAALDAVIDGQPQLRRRGELQAAVDLAAGGSQSAGEMRLFAFMRASKLPTPVRQFRVRTAAGSRYLDCAIPAYRLAIEYDGKSHLTDRQRNDDLSRDQELRRLKWHTVRVTAARLRDERALTADIWHELDEQASRLGIEQAQR